MFFNENGEEKRREKRRDEERRDEETTERKRREEKREQSVFSALIDSVESLQPSAVVNLGRGFSL